MNDQIEDTRAVLPSWLNLSVAAWGALVIAASLSGLLGALGDVFMPGFAILVAGGIIVPTVSYFALPFVRKTVDAIGHRRLTLFHIWRIPAGGLFLYYAYTGELPAVFALLAGIGDVLAGIGATAVMRYEATAQLLRRIHLFGFADFIIAVGTGLTYTLMNDPLMITLTTLPMALIPLFGVGLSGASHIIILSNLKTSAK